LSYQQRRLRFRLRARRHNGIVATKLPASNPFKRGATPHPARPAGPRATSLDYATRAPPLEGGGGGGPKTRVPPARAPRKPPARTENQPRLCTYNVSRWRAGDPETVSRDGKSPVSSVRRVRNSPRARAPRACRRRRRRRVWCDSRADGARW